MTVIERKKWLISTYKISPYFAERIISDVPLEEFNEETIKQYLKSKPKPFVKWVGGKRQLIAQFNKLGILEPSGFNPKKNTYHEPFVGGGAIFFELLPLKAELSDLNKELVTTYNIIKDDVDSLINTLQSKKYIYDKDVFLRIRAEEVNELSDLEVAARFIYLNRTAFNGMYRVNKSGGFNVPYGRYNNPLICDEINLHAVSLALKKVRVKHQDYRYVLNKAKCGDFVYFDPPYYPISKTASFTSYTSDSFLDKEQKELRDVFLELHRKNCYVALSNSDTAFINNLFEPLTKEGIKINKVQAGRAINSKAGKRGKVCELLVSNY